MLLVPKAPRDRRVQWEKMEILDPLDLKEILGRKELLDHKELRDQQV